MKKNPICKVLIVALACLTLFSGCSVGGAIMTYTIGNDSFVLSCGDGWSFDNDQMTLTKDDMQIDIVYITEEDFQSNMTALSEGAQSGAVTSLNYGTVDKTGDGYIQIETQDGQIQRMIWFEGSEYGAVYTADNADEAEGFDHITYELKKAKGNQISHKDDMKNLVDQYSKTIGNA